MRRRGEVLPRSLIASLVWDMNFDSDTNVIDVAIRRLRVKIDDGFELKLIKTIRGMGYTLDTSIPLSLAFIAVAAWLFLRMSDSGQFDDLDSPAHSILFDDTEPLADNNQKDDSESPE